MLDVTYPCLFCLFVFFAFLPRSRGNLLSHVEVGQVKIFFNSIAILVSALVRLKPCKYEN